MPLAKVAAKGLATAVRALVTVLTRVQSALPPVVTSGPTGKASPVALQSGHRL
jgi:hypothetical protein